MMDWLKCVKCKDKIRLLDLGYCKKCEKINLSLGYISGTAYFKVSNELDELWVYIWDYSLKEKGVEYYMKARDKLLIEIDKELEMKRINKEKDKKKLLKKYELD